MKHVNPKPKPENSSPVTGQTQTPGKPGKTKGKTQPIDVHELLSSIDPYELLRQVVEGQIEDIKPKTDPFKEGEYEVWTRCVENGREMYGYYEVKITEDGKVKILYEQWWW